MKILHTADWHLGQLFHDYDRSHEHQQFLSWLVETLYEQKIDVLLLTGDVFDISNPSAQSVKIFYTFLNKATQKCPHLQIIVIAGNHDSASRLESPKPLLESSNIHIIGVIDKKHDTNNNTQQIDYEKLVIPIYDNKGIVKIWCLAIPFLRMGDYPNIENSQNPYTAGVMALYQNVYEYALTKQEKGQSIIAMGHLHAAHAEINNEGDEKNTTDKSERPIMGGVECIPATAFHENIKYVALGHIHKAQKIGGAAHIRYSGSPIPLSFSEINYKHQVVIFDLDNEEISNLTAIEVPLTVPLWRIPAKHANLEEVIAQLQTLDTTNFTAENAPYLEVRVLLEQPEPALRNTIENILAAKKVRLAKIDVKYNTSNDTKNQDFVTPDKLQELQPIDIFSKIYTAKYNNPIPTEIITLFNQVVEEVNQKER
jgi:exonuclease SbcD